MSQSLAASLAHVLLPDPEGPTRAVTSPSFAVKLTLVRTSFESYAKETLSNTMSWPSGWNVSLPPAVAVSLISIMRSADTWEMNISAISVRLWSNGA